MNRYILLFIAAAFSFAFALPVHLKSVEYKQVENIINPDPASGKALVRKKACTLCHNPKKKIVGPSFNAIANKYEGNYLKILEFLEGKTAPIVQPDEFKYMKPVLKQLEKMTKEEKEAIAKFISYYNISN